MVNGVRVLTLVALILVFSLFYLEIVSAEITIDGETIHVETDNYTVQFDRGVITQLHNKLTDETYTLPPRHQPRDLGRYWHLKKQADEARCHVHWDAARYGGRDAKN